MITDTGESMTKKNVYEIVFQAKKDFKCEICGKGFKEKQGMMAHVSNIHMDRRRFKCPGVKAIKPFFMLCH
jgi:hypothetical protein